MRADQNKPQNEPKTSPFGRKLLDDLRHAGNTGLSPQKLKGAGVVKELKGLVKQGFAVSLEGPIYLSIETYELHTSAILDGRKLGETITVSDARNRTGLSRKYLFPLLNRMESDGLVKRDGDVRVVMV
jgi:selenocysteine-specific elongation factor